MNIKYALENFLYDKDFFISIYSDHVYVYNYDEIEILTNDKIVLKINNFKVNIIGSNLKIEKLNKKELLIEGIINNIGKIYD